MNTSMQNLPPEMQARINNIIAQAQAPGAQTPKAMNIEDGPPPAPNPVMPQGHPPAAKPSLMDHVVALRGETNALRAELQQMSQQLAASSQVIEAMGGAMGQLYQMFCQQTETTDYGGAYQEDTDY